MNPTAWLPDDTLVTWALRNGIPVGAVTDVATGRLSIGGREIGDTGWRTAGAMLGAGWSAAFGAGQTRIRRSGNVVEVQALIENTSGASKPGSGGVIFAPVAGFNLAGNHVTFCPQIGGYVATAISTLITGFFSNSAAIAAGGYIAWTTTWLTADAWPATLPGTPL